MVLRTSPWLLSVRMCLRLRRNSRQASAAKIVKVDRRRVQEWCGQKEKPIALRTTESARSKRLTGGGRKVTSEDMEKKVLEWLNERRKAGARVTGKSLRQCAMKLHRENDSQSFKASAGWYSRFKKRNGISHRRSTHVAQKSCMVTDARIDGLLRFVVQQRKRRDYT